MRAKDLPIKIMIGTDQRDLARELEIEQADLYGELSSQPSWYAYYATLMVESGISYDQAKSELENLQAEVANSIRADAAKGAAKITEKRIELEVTANSRVQSKKRAVQQKHREHETLKVVVKAFEQRLQSLISLCTLERIQFKGEEHTTNPTRGSSPFRNNPQFPPPGGVTAKEEMMEELKRIRGSSITPTNS